MAAHHRHGAGDLDHQAAPDPHGQHLTGQHGPCVPKSAGAVGGRRRGRFASVIVSTS
jgi:hypothetical protein